MAREPMPPLTFADARKSAMTRMGGAPGGAPMAGDPAPAGGLSDAETGYVEHVDGPRCGNCTYLSGTQCNHPKVAKAVSPQAGMCHYWDDGSGQPGIDTGAEATAAPLAAPAAPLGALGMGAKPGL